AARRRIRRERHGEQSREAMVLDGVPRHGHERLAGDAASPVRLAEPVPDLRRHAVHVFLQHEPDGAHGLAVYGDGEDRFGFAFAYVAEERLAVAPRVRIRELVAEVDPDV